MLGFGKFFTASTIKAAGTGFYYPFSLLFFAAVLDTSYAQVGAVLTVSNFLALPLLPLVGRLVDYAGGKISLIATLLVRSSTFILVIAWPSVGTFVVVAVLNAVATRADAVAMPILCVELFSRERMVPRWLAVHRATFNLGFGIGTIAAGTLVSLNAGTVGKIGFIVAAAFTISAGLFAPLKTSRQTTTSEPWSSKPLPSIKSTRRGFMRGVDLRYGLLTVVSSVAAATGLFLESLLAPYLLAHTPAPAWLAGVLLALNTALLALLFVPLEGIIGRRRQIRALRLSLILVIGGLASVPIVGVGGPAVWVAVVVLSFGIIVYSFGELISTQVLGVLLATLPEPEHRGSALSFGQLVGGAVAALVPWLTGLVLDTNSGWLWVAVLVPMMLAVAITSAPALRTRLDVPVADVVRTNG
ncbi:MFS transporter [Curtobacterium flaccumfaciens]|uniref:MFS transporter n=1 Tax=Curtobacterium flaccumfaciens TaxID=2035 RepID=UPI0039A0285E